MSSVDRLGNLLAQLRSSLLEKSRQGTRLSKAAGKGPERASGSSVPSSSSIRAGLLSHLESLDLGTEQDLLRARRLFIELVLVTEFGGKVAGDPRFSALANQVEAAISEDPATSTELTDVLRDLAAPI